MTENTDHKIRYQRVVIKISGEVLQGTNKFGIDLIVLKRILQEIKYLVNMGVQIVIVVGGGNLFRGHKIKKIGMSQVVSDQIGMLSTIINGLAIQDVMDKISVNTHLMSAIAINGVCNSYNVHQAIRYLSKKYVVICAGGSGHTCFTTDFAACLRGVELQANIVLKGTKVDGIYSADPIKTQNAILYHKINYKIVLNKELKIMDYSAFILARDHKLPICVFNINKPGSLYRIIIGKKEGTLVSN